jgi:phospholipid/cholesterol/gamma-HCH transport system substrate-binding protein
MMGWLPVKRTLAIGSCVMVTVTGCAFHGLNSLPLPGAPGRGESADIYHVEIANVGTLESNSPVMIDDVQVGSVGPMTVKGPPWHADVEISVKRNVVIPANVVASVGQTSLLGSMHLELNPPLHEPAQGRLQPGKTIPLSRSSTYPSTEQTLSSLAVLVNGGGLGQLGEIIHNFSAALSGRGAAVRDLINRLDTFVGTFDQQRDSIVSSIQALNRLAATFAGQRDALSEALRKVPPALEVLIKERPRLTAALDKLRVFSNTATAVINNTQADLVRNLKNLGPTLEALANVGPKLAAVIEYLSHFPFTQNMIDRAVRGDFFNLYFDVDLTIPRLKKDIFLGTHWGQQHEEEVPAPGDPWWMNYTLDPFHGGFAPSPNTPAGGALPPGAPPPGPPSGVPPAGPQAPPPGPPPAPAAAPPLNFSAPLSGPAASPPGFGPLPGPSTGGGG